MQHEVNDTLMGIKEFNLSPQINFVAKYDTLRISAAIFKPVPQWAGFMRLLTRDNVHNGMYKIDFLPFFDLNPSDESTMFTTLNFVINDALKSAQKPIVTFDQPLWYKAMMIKKSKNLDITILLGNFHTQMSILSAIRYVMQNSGIKEIFSLAFAEHSAEKMLSGRQYARSMRAHDLLHTVLKIILFEQIDDSSVIQHASGIYTSNQSFGHLDFDQNNNTIDLRLDEVEKVEVKLSGTERNRLWLIYREMVEILFNNLMA